MPKQKTACIAASQSASCWKPTFKIIENLPLQRTTSADDDVLARDCAGMRPQKERGELGDFFWRNEPSDWRLLRRGSDSVGINKHRCCSSCGSHDVDGDLSRHELGSPRPREADQRRFGCGVLATTRDPCCCPT